MATVYYMGSTQLPFTEAEMLRLEELQEIRNENDNLEYAGFEIDVEERIVWSMEDFQPEVVAELVAQVLDERPEEDRTEVEIAFAVTCSKPRPGEFGGGSIYVTRKGIEEGVPRFVAVTSVDGALGASVHRSEFSALESIAGFLRGRGFAGQATREAMADFVATQGLAFDFAVHETRVD